MVRLVGDTRGLKSSLREAEKAASNSAAKFKQIGKAMSLAISLPLSAVGAAATFAFAEFDKAIIESMALVEDATEHMAAFREQTIAMSKEMPHAAAGLAEAYKYLILAGKSAEQASALLEGVAKFATAGAFDLKKAVDLATDVQTAMGLASKDAAQDAKNMTRVTDVLVKANTIANASTEQFAKSLFRAAPAATIYGKSIEETTAILAAFASKGIKESYAGGLLERGLRLLIKASQTNAEEFEALGFSVFDASGKMKNHADVIQNLEQIMKGMTDQQKAATLATLGFEARMQNAILPLIGMSGAIRDYQKQLEDAAGTTDKIQKFQMQSFSNQMLIVKNHVTALAIDIGEKLVPVLVVLGETVKFLTEAWKALPESVKTTVVVLGILLAAAGPVIFAWSLMAVGVAKVSTALLLLRANVAGVAAAFVILKPVIVAAFAVAAVTVFAKAIYNLNGDVRSLNEELERGKKLGDELVALRRQMAGKTIARAAELPPTARVRELKDAIEEASASLAGYERQLNDAEKELESGTPGIGDAVGQARLEIRVVTRQSLVDEQKKKVEELRKALDDARAAAARIPEALDPTAAATEAFAESMADIEKHATGIEETTDAILLAENALRLARSAGVRPELLKRMEELIGRAKFAEEFREITDEWERFNEEVKNVVKSLEDQRDTMGMTADQAEIYRQEMALADLIARGGPQTLREDTEARIANAKAIAEQKKALEQVADLEREAKDLTESLLTPVERYNKEMEKLNELKPFLGVETFNRAVKDSKDRLDEATKSTRDLGREIGRVEGVAAGGAEARSQVFEFRERLAEQRKRTPSPDDAGAKADRQQAAQVNALNEQKELLKKNNEILEKIRKGLGGRIGAANLGDN